MAEDPGVSTLAAIIEAMRQAFNLVHDTTRAVISAVVDTYRTRMYMSYRRQAGQNKESSLKHGKQSLKQLRRHEDHGAQIV